MNEKAVKILGVVLSAAGAAITFASSCLDDKKLEIKVAKEVAKALEK